MKTEKVLPTGRLVDSIYKNNVESVTMNGHKDGADRRSKLSAEEIAQAIVMHIYGVETIDIAKALDVNYLIAYHAVVRKTHRALKLPFQISKKKSLGKMVFTYDEGLVREYYGTLPNELKGLCSELISDRLVVKSKLLKSEMYLQEVVV